VLTLAVTYAPLLGGAERTLLDFAGGLDGRVVLACPDGPLARRARDEGFTVFRLRRRPLELRAGAVGRLRAFQALAGHAAELRRFGRELEPDLVLAWGMRSGIAAGFALPRRRPALVIRHVDFLPGPLIARLLRVAARRAERVSVNSRAVGRDLDPNGRLGERLAVIPPGIESARYEQATERARDPEVLVLGALEPWKRPDVALEAVALAARELPTLKLTMAGRPISERGRRLEAVLRERAQRFDLAGRVTFAGQLDDPRPAFGRSWCLLHAADREPFGSVVLQALASSRPVVAPAAGGPAEIVTDDCGRLFDPGDPAAAGAALVEVLSAPDRAAELGAAARRRAAVFSAENQRRRFAELGRAAVADRPSARARARGATGAGLALVTVTHNSGDVIGTLLDSARRHLPDARAIVVDSGSSDDSAARARAAGAGVIELGQNVGFGRACNAGVARVTQPVCALVNPDVELLDDSIARLAAELCSDGGLERILAPLTLSPDGSRQDTAQLHPRSPLLALQALVPAAALPGPLGTPLAPWRARRPRPIGWAVGSCLVAPTETLRRLGPFDEGIFLFAEDLDVGLRAAQAGIETWFRPDARVLHLDAHSTAPTFGGEPVDLLARQRRAVIGERLGAGVARRDHWTWVAIYASRILLKGILGRSNARERRQLRAQLRAGRMPARL
jgi:N-acetylglucosaminyl-diphospho-decaprenol L-rhamnosyltransferase